VHLILLGMSIVVITLAYMLADTILIFFYIFIYSSIAK